MQSWTSSSTQTHPLSDGSLVKLQWQVLLVPSKKQPFPSLIVSIEAHAGVHVGFHLSVDPDPDKYPMQSLCEGAEQVLYCPCVA